jgi:hypothetical protein
MGSMAHVGWYRLWTAAGLLVLLQLALVVSRSPQPSGHAAPAPARAPLGAHAGHTHAQTALAGGGAALSFNGTNSYVRVADSASLRIPVMLTVEAWIRPTAVPTGHRHVVGKNNYELSVEPQGAGFKAKMEFSSGGNWREVQSGQLAINQWYHLAGTYDGSNLRLYVNGSRVGSLTTSGNIDQTSSPLRIGAADAAGDFFRGIIDEVRISGVIRYPGNFVPPQGPFAPDAGTRGLWHFDEGSGAVAADASGSGNAGTLVNGPTWTTTVPFSGPDTTPPALSAIAASNLTTSGATIGWVSDEPATSRVEYGTTIAYGSATTLDAALVLNHSQPLAGLAPGTTYHYRVSSRDAAGNTATSGDATFTTASSNPPPAPVISGLGAGNITPTGATISWSTDVPADSQVEYGPTTAYGSTTPLDPATTTTHSQPLSGLTANTTYHYRVKSRGQNGVLATSGDAVFVTGNATAATIGQWSPTLDWPLVAVHMALLPTGEVLIWDGWELAPNVNARVWNPTSQTFTAVTNRFSSIFCSGQAMLPDGRQLVVGGFATAEYGIKDANIFNPATGSWTRVADMHHARWYPSATTLADGRVLVLGGAISPGVYADVPEVYDPATNTWTELANARLNVGEYPLTYLLPDGKVFLVAARSAQSRTLDVNAQVWSTVGAAPVWTGSAATYRPGQILATGGGTNNADPVIRDAAVIDMTAGTPAWRTVAPMAYPRFQHNLITLPDGKVLAVGGSTQYSLVSTSGILPAELWDPATEGWATMAAMQQPRMYHSAALLLPDGRVLVAGGGRAAPAADYLTAQIYSPPYLFRGARPTIASAPGSATYGATLAVQTPDAAEIASVALVRLPSVTHAFDMDQRFVPLTFTRSGDTLTVQAPPNANIAPPGDYMLFINTGGGVPSVARIVRLGGAPPADTQAPTVAITAPAGGATVSGAGVTVTASASDNVSVASVQFLLDGAPLGAPVTSAPHTIVWDTTTAGNGAHTLSARARDGAGNVGTAGAVTVTVANVTADTTPPAISAIAATNVQSGGATIGWATDEPATSQVEYGTTSAYGATTPLDPTLRTGHSQPLTGLTPGTTYHYRVVSRDAAGNTATSADRTFTTAAAAPQVLLGSQAIEGQTDYNAAGMAEAFQYTATASGTVASLSIYIDPSSTATRVVVGLYSNARDDTPNILLAQATITSPVAGAWNTVSIPAVSVTAGGQYWIAVLGPTNAGVVRFRDAPSGGKAQTSAQSDLSLLPATWTAGATYYNSPMSAFATAGP